MSSKSTFSINKNIEIIKLLATNDINRYTRNYNFLHIGLVKEEVKELYLLGLDVSI